MNLNEGELLELLRYVNNEGAKRKRLINVQLLPITTSSNFWDQFFFIFDDGPLNASDDPWPGY